MRTAAWGVALLLLLGGATWWLMGRSAEAPPDESSRASQTPDAPPEAPPTAASPALRGAPPGEAKASHPNAKSAATRGAEAPPGSSVRVIGKLVEKGKPVAGANVKIQAPRLDPVSGASADDGAFALTAPVPPGEGSLMGSFAARTATSAALRSVVLRPDPAWAGWVPAEQGDVRDLGAVELKPAFSFDVEVTTAGGAPVVAEVSVVQGSVGFPGWFLASKTDARGLAKIESLPGGATYRVFATAAGHGRGTVEVALPRDEPGPVRVSLAAERTLDVLVVEVGNEAPVPGATVHVHELLKMEHGLTRLEYAPPPSIAPTDGAGRTRIVGLAPTDAIYLMADAPGFGKSRGGMSPATRVKETDTETKILLKRLRRVTWPVVDGERPVPADGTALVLKSEPGSGGAPPPPSGRVEGRRIVVEGADPGYFMALAYTPDGAVARLWSDDKKDEGRETSFRAVRRIEVSLSYADGKPAEGWSIVARNQGNNPMGPAVKTDANGKAVLDGMQGQLVEVYAGDGTNPYGGTRIGSVDLEKGSGRVEGVVEREREAIVRLRLAGRPGVPEGMTLTVNWQPVASPQIDEASATVRAKYRPSAPGAKCFVYVQAPGYQAKQQEFTPPADGSTATIDVDLAPAGRLVVRIVRAPGYAGNTTVQRWDDSKSDWIDSGGTNSFGPGQLVLDAKGVGRLDALVPGRYRILETASGATSAAVDVVAGGAPVEAVLDLTNAGLVKGRVVVPEGFNAGEVTVERDGIARSTTPWGFQSGVPAGLDGSFQARVPGNVPVTFRPVHPFLVPAPEDGTAVVTEPREGIVLRMVKANVATVRFDREPRAQYNPGQKRQVKALLYKGEPVGAPAQKLTAVLEGSTARFGGFEPGTWTVWIDADPFVPVVLRDVALGTGETDLGTVATSDGASVRVTVRVKDGQAIPRLNVWASRTGDEPTYARSTEGRTAEIVLKGLGVGTFRVMGSATMGAPGGLDKTVECDGVHDVPLTIDLR